MGTIKYESYIDGQGHKYVLGFVEKLKKIPIVETVYFEYDIEDCEGLPFDVGHNGDFVIIINTTTEYLSKVTGFDFKRLTSNLVPLVAEACQKGENFFKPDRSVVNIRDTGYYGFTRSLDSLKEIMRAFNTKTEAIKKAEDDIYKNYISFFKDELNILIKCHNCYYEVYTTEDKARDKKRGIKTYFRRFDNEENYENVNNEDFVEPGTDYNKNEDNSNINIPEKDVDTYPLDGDSVAGQNFDDFCAQIESLREKELPSANQKDETKESKNPSTNENNNQSIGPAINPYEDFGDLIRASRKLSSEENKNGNQNISPSMNSGVENKQPNYPQTNDGPYAPCIVIDSPATDGEKYNEIPTITNLQKEIEQIIRDQQYDNSLTTSESKQYYNYEQAQEDIPHSSTEFAGDDYDDINGCTYEDYLEYCRTYIPRQGVDYGYVPPQGIINNRDFEEFNSKTYSNETAEDRSIFGQDSSSGRSRRPTSYVYIDPLDSD